MQDFIVERFADGEQVDTINVSRKGALNQALISRLTEISVSDEWDVAKHEWRATGNVWYRPLKYEGTQIQELPSPHQENHPNYCVCGHPIAWHFEVENTENGTKEILGSEHITNWMIIRHLIEDKGIPESAITEEKIIEWMKEAVKTMKAEWWWKENGEDWEEMFEQVKELDVRINVRSKGRYFDYSTKRYEPHMVIAKTKTNSLGKMASVVWRWNHPDNPRRQIDTRGYPQLWRDVRVLYAKAQKFERILDEKMEEVEQRKAYVREQQSKAEEIAEQNRQRMIEKANEIRANTKKEYDNKALEEACEYYDIPMFSIDDGKNDWERRFLNNMTNRIIKRQTLSVKQLNTLLRIIAPSVDEEPATSKQINYIMKLGANVPDDITKSEASKMISDLLNKGE